MIADRIGAAIVDPARAMADADRGVGGAPDVFWLLLLKLICGEFRAIVAAVWAGLVLGPGVAWSGLLARITSAWQVDFALILVGGLAVTIGAGRKRAITRDFDLACAAWIPVLAIDVVASLVMAIAGARFPRSVETALSVLSILWMGALVILAIRVARRRS